ncbi:Rrf2 family transcriptional regulator [uncultured Veillonella sp.]|uniref:RrF2 family transcriptional regulator n=1 Tax=uncultured Veillonella sp. TaxID=159268 RepID=UPI00260FEB96|nr:Rrf2 family transcriptional regulator [uncultured Veillonella sp.]
MKLNTATDYAFRMVLHMALLPNGTKITGSELAKAQKIPDRFLLKIMRPLIASGIMRSFRGVDGGFALAKQPKEVTLFDVIEAVEGATYLQRCLYDNETCSRGCHGSCAVQESFCHIQKNLITELKAVDFETLAKREREIHLKRGCPSKAQARDC